LDGHIVDDSSLPDPEQAYLVPMVKSRIAVVLIVRCPIVGDRGSGTRGARLKVVIETAPGLSA